MKNRKLNISYAIKAFGLKMDDFDEGSRKVSGYLSAFGVKDSDMDIIHPGSFAKSISERGPVSTSNRKIQFLRMHDWNNQIGKFLELSEDERGLKFVAQMGRSTKGEDAFRDYQDEIIKEHSIGFRYVDGKIEYNEEEGHFDITEVNLFEGSAVTFGANEFTPVLQVAKGNKEDEFAKMQEELGAITKALKNGKGTDGRLYALEMRLAVLQQKYQNLFDANTQEPDKKKAALAEKANKDASGKQFLLTLLSK